MRASKIWMFVFTLATLGACDETPLSQTGVAVSGSGSGGSGATGEGGGSLGTGGATGSGGSFGTGGVSGTGGAIGGATGGASVDGGPPAPVVLPPTVTPWPYIDVVKTASSCAAAQGNPYAPASDAEVASLLLGRWELCSGSLSLTPTASSGLQFDRDRRWRALVRAGNKTLVPATGFDSEGAWYLASEDPKDMLFFNRSVLRMTTTGRGGSYGYPVQFLRNPTMMRISSDAVFVWLGE